MDTLAPFIKIMTENSFPDDWVWTLLRNSSVFFTNKKLKFEKTNSEINI